MSPLWRERLQVLVGRERVALGRLRLGYGTALKAWHVEPCPPGEQGRPWLPALRALEAALQAFPSRGGEATVILSNAFVRYQVVPWSDHVNGRAEREVYVQQRFQRVFGDDVRAWSIRLSEDRYGAPVLASAVDQDLLAAVRGALGPRGIVVASVQPYLMWAFNRWRAALGNGNWCLGLLEGGRLCLALAVEGVWHAVRTLPLEQQSAEVAVGELVERELRLTGRDAGQFKVFIRAPEHEGFAMRSDGDIRWRSLDERRGARRAPAGDALFGLAGRQ